jgi:hypothetical protein
VEEEQIIYLAPDQIVVSHLQSLTCSRHLARPQTHLQVQHVQWRLFRLSNYGIVANLIGYRSFLDLECMTRHCRKARLSLVFSSKLPFLLFIHPSLISTLSSIHPTLDHSILNKAHALTFHNTHGPHQHPRTHMLRPSPHQRRLHCI